MVNIKSEGGLRQLCSAEAIPPCPSPCVHSQTQAGTISYSSMGPPASSSLLFACSRCFMKKEIRSALFFPCIPGEANVLPRSFSVC